MAGVIKVSEAASLGMHAMMMLAEEPGRVMTTRLIAAQLGVSEAHLSKVLQRLARSGFVTAQRGPKGGFVLGAGNRDPTLLEVYECIDGPLEKSACLLGKSACSADMCILGGMLERTNEEFREYLAGTKLKELKGKHVGVKDGG